MKLSREQAAALALTVPPPRRGPARQGTNTAGVVAYCLSQAYPLPTPEFRFDAVRKWRFDLAWPAAMLALEVEGVTGGAGGRHQRREGYEADLVKYNAAALLGWLVLRATPRQIKSGLCFAWLDAAFAKVCGG